MPEIVSARKRPTARAIVTISLPVLELVRIDAAATKTGKTRSAFIRDAAVGRARRFVPADEPVAA